MTDEDTLEAWVKKGRLVHAYHGGWGSTPPRMIVTFRCQRMQITLCDSKIRVYDNTTAGPMAGELSLLEPRSLVRVRIREFMDKCIEAIRAERSRRWKECQGTWVHHTS